MRKILSVILCMILMLCLSAPAFAEQAEIASDDSDNLVPSAAANYFFFDSTSAGWQNFDRICCHIWEIESGVKLNDWGSKKTRCEDMGNGIWGYNLDDKGITIEEGKQYGVIFYAQPSEIQTYNLLAGAPCIGDTAYCDGSVYENPVNSEQSAQAAFWKGQDKSVYGPELKITSIGNVVGTCCAASTSPYKMFVEFLQNTLNNARTYSGKSDQQLIDDVAATLGLGQDDIASAIAESGVEGILWQASKSGAQSGSSDTAHTTGSGEKDSSANTSSGGQSAGRDGSSAQDSTTPSGSEGSGTTSSAASAGTASSGNSSSTAANRSSTATGQDTAVPILAAIVLLCAPMLIILLRRRTSR